MSQSVSEWVSEIIRYRAAASQLKIRAPVNFIHPCVNVRIHFFFIRNVCSGWGSSFLKFLAFEPIFFLFFFLIMGVLRLIFLIFFLNFWCSKAIFSYFFKYFTEICYPGLENGPHNVKMWPILYFYAFMVYFWPKTNNI